MSTELITIEKEDGWVQFAEEGEDFTCELLELGYAEITVQDTTPNSSTAYHTLRAGTLFVRPGTGNAYARVSPAFPTSSVKLVVST